MPLQTLTGDPMKDDAPQRKQHLNRREPCVRPEHDPAAAARSTDGHRSSAGAAGIPAPANLAATGISARLSTAQSRPDHGPAHYLARYRTLKAALDAAYTGPAWNSGLIDRIAAALRSVELALARLPRQDPCVSTGLSAPPAAGPPDR